MLPPLNPSVWARRAPRFQRAFWTGGWPVSMKRQAMLERCEAMDGSLSSWTTILIVRFNLDEVAFVKAAVSLAI